MAHIFISYSHMDSDYANRLARWLEQKGFVPWIDERVDYGTQWPRVIQDYLDSCGAFIVVMSPRSYQSEWVQNELARAQTKKKPIFPLLLEGDIWLSVQATQCVDVREQGLPPEKFYKRLSKVVPPEAKVAAPSPPPAHAEAPPSETILDLLGRSKQDVIALLGEPDPPKVKFGKGACHYYALGVEVLCSSGKVLNVSFLGSGFYRAYSRELPGGLRVGMGRRSVEAILTPHPTRRPTPSNPNMVYYKYKDPKRHPEKYIYIIYQDSTLLQMAECITFSLEASLSPGLANLFTSS